MILAALIAWALRGSIVASAAGSFAGNPITYPLIWVSTYKLGNLILGVNAGPAKIEFQNKAEAVWSALQRMSGEAIISALEAFWPILKPMIIGSIPVGAAAAFLSYFAVRKLVESTRHNRLERFKFEAI